MSENVKRGQKAVPSPKGQVDALEHKLGKFAAAGASAQAAADRVLERIAPSVRKLESVTLDELEESSVNPRRTFDEAKLAELAASIREAGILQPLLVRPISGRGVRPPVRFEIVFGHRRFRASKLAGLERVPVDVRELDDGAVLELQLVENLQRADLTPIEEAAGYRRMCEVLKLSAEQLATRLGISRSTIYERLRLLELPDSARQAVATGKLPASTAALLVRIADPKAREKAVAEVLAGEEHAGAKGAGEPLSFRAARDLVRTEYLLELKSAGFDLDDGELVKGALSCRACPKRTANMVEAPTLFGADGKGPGSCTDGGCFRAKLAAHWTRRAAEHRAAGGTVLADKVAAKVIVRAYGGADRVVHGSGWVDLAGAYWDARPLRQVLAAAKVELPVVLARGPSGRVLELVKRSDVEKALDKGSKRKAAESASQAAARRSQELERKRAREAVAKRRAILAGFHARIAADWPQDAKLAARALRAVVRALVLEVGAEPMSELERACGVEAGDRAKFEKGLLERATGEGSSVTESVRVGLELALSAALLRSRWAGGQTKTQCDRIVDEVLQLAGLDRKNLEAQGAAVVRRAIAKTDGKAKGRKPAGSSAKARRTR